MGNRRVNLIIIALLCNLLNAMAQRDDTRRIPYDNFNAKWEEFRYRSKGDMGVLRRYFRDTLSVDEMKTAFYAYKGKKITASPYAEFDSIVNGFHDLSVMLNSPLRNHPMKKARNMRGVWGRGKRFFLHQLLDGNGVPDDDILKKVNKDTVPLMDRVYVFLRAPRHYMGFIVSPLPSADIFNKTSRIGTAGFNDRPLDFFSFTGPSRWFDGEWYHRTEGGGKLLGTLLSLYCDSKSYAQERTFSVLLYESPKSFFSRKEYTLELLDPETPDEETLEAFDSMKYFVENLRYNSFNPLYTTDFRIMTGRYYRVTVSKCGWLVEDYFDIKE